MALRPPAIGDLKNRDLYEAVHRGLLQHDRLLMLDTPLGKNALTPLRARECMPDSSCRRLLAPRRSRRGLARAVRVREQRPACAACPKPDALHIELSRTARSTGHQ